MRQISLTDYFAKVSVLGLTVFQTYKAAWKPVSDDLRPLQKALLPTAETQTQVFGYFRYKYPLILPK